MIEGFLLGLASGVTCLATCIPALIPFLLGEGRPTRENWIVLLKFLGGRLAGYLLFGLLAWAGGQILLGESAWRGLILGLAYAVLAGLLLFYGLSKPRTVCAGSMSSPRVWLDRWPSLMPIGLGFLVGVNLCPPFLLALAHVAGMRDLLESLLFFAAFFVGTSLYFIPAPFVGALRRIEPLRTIGKLAAVLMALYYLFSGILLLAGGIVPS